MAILGSELTDTCTDMFDSTFQKVKSRGAAATENTQPTNQPPSCGINRVCEPTGMRVERVLLFEGPREVEVIQECHCEIKLTQCMRVPALRTYYSETPYETVIDVGGCSGSKGSPGACGSDGDNRNRKQGLKTKQKQKKYPQIQGKYKRWKWESTPIRQ